MAAFLEEPAGKKWIVQKFGGTSLGKYPASIADIIKNSLDSNRIAVICSARSTETKNEGTTSRLLRAARIAETKRGPGAREDFSKIVQAIESDHIKAASISINSSTLQSTYKEAVKAECLSLLQVLESIWHIEETSPRAENKVISTGEKLAAQFLAALLEDRGVPAQYINLADVIQRFAINADRNTPDHDLYAALAKAFRQDISACEGKVPVITGYFGNLPDGLLSRIGRGYSDLTAALAAIGVSASELQIWKEVEGVFTADPRKVPTAYLLPSILPSEAAELTFYGSEVIHPFTMEQVINAEIPIRIKNVKNPRGTGTVILPDPDNIKSESRLKLLKLSRSKSSADLGLVQMPRRPTAVTIKRSLLVLNVYSNKKTRSHGFLARIFQILDKRHLSVDLIASSEVHVSLALHSDSPMVSGSSSSEEVDSDELEIDDEQFKQACHELGELGSISIVTDLAIISLVGQQLKHMVGISGKFCGILGEAGINIEMISQGASEINVSCVISERDADKALNVVHAHLFDFVD